MHNTNQTWHRGQTTSLVFVLMTVFMLLLSSCGAPAARVYRVGILVGADFGAPTAESFKARMTELGYIEGQNIVYDLQQTNFEPARDQAILEQFVADKVDLIFVLPTEAALAAKAATAGTNIPVVFSIAFVEGNDLIESVRQPGGNITGVRVPGPDIAVKRLEILHQVAPQARRIWVPYLQGYPSIIPVFEVLRPAAAAMGLTLVETPVSSPADIQADLQARAQAADIGMDAILFIPEPINVNADAFAAVAQFAAEHKLPIAGTFILQEGHGPVLSYLFNNADMGQRAAPLADKVLKGTSAGTIPVISPENELRINYRVAQALGLTVPESLLSQAVEIVR